MVAHLHCPVEETVGQGRACVTVCFPLHLHLGLHGASAKMAAKRRVQRAIQLELPSVSFDEEVVSYFACAYENGDSELEVVSA